MTDTWEINVVDEVWTCASDPSVVWVTQVGGVASGGGGGVTVHNALSGRSEPSAHPIAAVTGLPDVLTRLSQNDHHKILLIIVDPGFDPTDSGSWTAVGIEPQLVVGELAYIFTGHTGGAAWSGAGFYEGQWDGVSSTAPPLVAAAIRQPDTHGQWFTRGLLDLRATPNPAQPEWLMNLDTFKAMYLSDNDGFDFPHVVRLAEIMPGTPSTWRASGQTWSDHDVPVRAEYTGILAGTDTQGDINDIVDALTIGGTVSETVTRVTSSATLTTTGVFVVDTGLAVVLPAAADHVGEEVVISTARNTAGVVTVGVQSPDLLQKGAGNDALSTDPLSLPAGFIAAFRAADTGVLSTDPGWVLLYLTPATPTSGGGGAVDSVNGATGTVVLTAGDVGAATAAQGATADTAVQLADLPTFGDIVTHAVSEFATAAHNHSGVYDPAGTASTAVTAHTGATDPHGDRAAAVSAISTHAAATDPHGDRAYAAGLVDDLSGVTNQATARTNLGLGTAATTAATAYATAAQGTTADGAVQKSVVDAKGDLLVGTADNTVARLAVGTNGQALVAKSGATEGVGWAFITPQVVGCPPAAAGDWVLLSSLAGTGGQTVSIGGTATASNSAARYIPFTVGRRIGIGGLGIEIVAGNGGASAVLRLGIHADNAGRPGTVVADVTATATTGVKEATFTEVMLDPGEYWAVIAFQSLDTAGTNPTIRAAAAMGSPANRTSLVSSSNQQASLGATVSGALAANPSTSAVAVILPHLWMKITSP